MRSARSARRHRTRLWFGFYTLVLVAIAAVSIASSQWSVALTTLAIAVVFFFVTRRFLRRR